MSRTFELHGETITVHDAADALNYKTPSLVMIENDEIRFISHGYWIELSKIKTRRDLIQWIHHLLEKQWVTTPMIRQFIEQVCKYRNWKIYGDV